MDFLKIRRKAKERSARAAPPGEAAPAGGQREAPPAPPAAPPATAAAAAGPAGSTTTTPPPAAAPAAPAATPAAAPAAPPAGPVRALPGSPEALAREAAVGARVAALPFAPDSRFVTWRPDGAGLPDLEGPVPAEEPARAQAIEPAAPRSPLDDFFYRDDEADPGTGLAAPAEEESLAPAALDEYLTCQLGGELYGLEIGRVLEVLRTPRLTEVPRAPADVAGIITVRGEVITVLDPRARIGLPRAEGPPAGRVVIVHDGEGSCGLLVDRVTGVVRLPRGSLEACPQALGTAGADTFLGIGREGDRLFLVLDPGALLRPLRRVGEARLA